MQHIFNLLDPVRCATKTLSVQQARIADVIPTFASVIDAVSAIDVPLSATGLKKALISTISSRLSMLMNCERTLLTRRTRNFSTVAPNELVVASYLNPRYAAAMNMYFKYSARLLTQEIDVIFSERFRDEQTSGAISRDDEVDKDSSEQQKAAGFSIQSWVERSTSGNCGNQRSRARGLESEVTKYLDV